MDGIDKRARYIDRFITKNSFHDWLHVWLYEELQMQNLKDRPLKTVAHKQVGLPVVFYPCTQYPAAVVKTTKCNTSRKCEVIGNAVATTIATVESCRNSCQNRPKNCEAMQKYDRPILTRWSPNRKTKVQIAKRSRKREYGVCRTAVGNTT